MDCRTDLSFGWQGKTGFISSRQGKTGISSGRQGKTGINSGRHGGLSPLWARNDRAKFW